MSEHTCYTIVFIANHNKIMLADPMSEDCPAIVKTKCSTAKSNLLQRKSKLYMYPCLNYLNMYINLTEFCVNVWNIHTLLINKEAITLTSNSCILFYFDLSIDLNNNLYFGLICDQNVENHNTVSLLM